MSDRAATRAVQYKVNPLDDLGWTSTAVDTSAVQFDEVGFFGLETLPGV